MKVFKLFCPQSILPIAASVVLALFSNLILVATSVGQSLPTLDYGGRPTDTRPELLESSPRAPAPKVQLPPVPSAAQSPAGSPARTVYIRQVMVTGSTVFSAEEIATITAAYEKRTLTIVEMESLRRELTLLYVNRGYINSGAVIPDQVVKDGLLSLQIVEGKINTIKVTGNKWFTEGYLRDRVALDTQTPVNVQRLQNRLQLLQQDDRIQLIHAELRPGDRPGDGELEVNVQEKPPISTWFAFNNYQSPSDGAQRGLATVAHRNLTGGGDVLSATYGYSSGVNPLLDIWYAVPVSARDTTLLMRYRKNDATVVDEEFGPLDIKSTSDSYELGVRHPFYKSLSQEFALALSAEYEHNETSLLGEPFSFAPGVENGDSVVVPIRFSQEWTYRTQQQVLAARSRFSLGLNAFGATEHSNENIPDGQFFAWLGQVQWAQNIAPWNIQLLARADVQYASKSLLPVEQMAVGGRYSVRGYRENLLVRDQGVIASLEARVPLLQDNRWADYLQLVPFIDYGQGSNLDIPTPSPKEISSVGLGLRWGATPFKEMPDKKIEAEIYWGHQLRRVETGYEDLQDDGIHFQLAMTLAF